MRGSEISQTQKDKHLDDPAGMRVCRGAAHAETESEAPVWEDEKVLEGVGAAGSTARRTS